MLVQVVVITKSIQLQMFTVHWGLIKTDQTIRLQPHSTSQQSNNNLLMIRPSQDLDPTYIITNFTPPPTTHNEPVRLIPSTK